MNSIITKYKEIDKSRYSRYLITGLIGLITLLFVGAFFTAKGAATGSMDMDPYSALPKIKTAMLMIKIARILVFAGFVTLVIDWIAYESERFHLDKILGVITFGFLSYVFVKWSGMISLSSRALKYGENFDPSDIMSTPTALFDFMKSIYFFEFAVLVALITLILNIMKLVKGSALVVHEVNQDSVDIVDYVQAPVAEMKTVEPTQTVQETDASQTVKDIPLTDQAVHTEPLPTLNVNKKTVSIIAGSIVLVFGLIFGYKFWDDNFNLTKVDLFAGIDVQYHGISPEGYALYNKIPSTTNNATVDNFMREVHYEFANDSDLSNGDTVTLIARIDDEQVKKAKLKISDLSKEYTVENLEEYVTSLDQIKNQDDLISDIKEASNSAESMVVGYFYGDKIQSGGRTYGPMLFEARVSGSGWFTEKDKYSQIRFVAMSDLIMNSEGITRGEVSPYTLSAISLENDMTFGEAKKFMESLGYTKIADK